MTKAERELLRALTAIVYTHVQDLHGLRGRLTHWEAAERLSELFEKAFKPNNLYIESTTKKAKRLATLRSQEIPK